MSEDLECVAEIRIRFTSKTVPSIGEIANAISIDDTALRGSTFQVIKIDAEYNFEAPNEKET